MRLAGTHARMLRRRMHCITQRCTARAPPRRTVPTAVWRVLTASTELCAYSGTQGHLTFGRWACAPVIIAAAVLAWRTHRVQHTPGTLSLSMKSSTTGYHGWSISADLRASDHRCRRLDRDIEHAFAGAGSPLSDMAAGKPSPGPDVAGVSPVPVRCGGLTPVPVQMWRGMSRVRPARGGPSHNKNVAGVSPTCGSMREGRA